MSNNFVICLVLSCIVAANSQGLGFFGFGGSFGFSSGGQNFHDIVLQSAAAKLRAQNLPADLDDRLTDVLENAQIAFAACETSIVFWQYKRCTALELRNAVFELDAIKQEAKLRNSTSDTASDTSSQSKDGTGSGASSASVPSDAPAASDGPAVSDDPATSGDASSTS